MVDNIKNIVEWVRDLLRPLFLEEFRERDNRISLLEEDYKGCIVTNQALDFALAVKERESLEEKEGLNSRRYWESKWPESVGIYKAQGVLERDVRTLLTDRSHILEPIVKLNELDKGTDDEKIVKILKWAVRNIQYEFDQSNHGVNEYWQHPEETLYLEEGDCEDFALLIKSLALIAGIPDYKVKVCAGWVQDPRDKRKKVGHAYCIYLREDNPDYKKWSWCIIDGTYYVDYNPVPKRIEHKQDSRYYPISQPIWWTFTLKALYSQKDVVVNEQ